MANIRLTHRLGLPAILVIITVYLAIVNYNSLPGQIPTHFGPSGEPDSWSAKSLSGVFSLPILQFGLYALLAWLTKVFSQHEDIKSIINLPGKDKLTQEQLESVRIAVVNGLFQMNLFTTAMLCYIQYGMFKVAYHQWSSLGPLVWIFTALIIFSVGQMLFKILQIRK